MEDMTTIKTLMNKPYQICIKHLQSEQCADYHVNLMNYFENCGTNLLKFA